MAKKKAWQKKNKTKKKRLSQAQQRDFISRAIDYVYSKIEGEFSQDTLMDAVHAELKQLDIGTIKNDYVEDMVIDFMEDGITHGFVERDVADDIVCKKCEHIFTNAQFCIKPTEYEIQHNILIPGHRFMPFCASHLPVWDITLKDSDGSEVAKKMIDETLQTLMLYHSLMGIEEVLGLVSSEDEENEDKIFEMTENPLFKITAFDMTELYQRYDFKEGDCLIARVEHYDHGICSLEYLPLATLRKSVAEISRWCELFTEGLHDVVNLYPSGCYDNHYLLATAFYSNSDYLLSHPVIHIGGFLAQSKEFTIHDVDGSAMVWLKDADIDEMRHGGIFGSEFDDDIYSGITEDGFDDFMDDFETMTTNRYGHDDNSMDNLFHILGYSINEGELEAYMRDELFQNTADAQLEHVMNRCFDERHKLPEFADINEVFYEKVRDKWSEVKEHYNRFADDRVGKMRTELLRITDLHLSWLRAMDSSRIEPSQLPEREMVQLAEVFSHVAEMLVLINNPDEASDKELKQMKKMLPMIEQTVQVMMKVIDDKM